MTGLPKMLHPAIVNERISRVKVINTVLQTSFGLTTGKDVASRRGSYDIFNDTRAVASASIPGTTSTTIARNPVGTVSYVIPRTAEKLPLQMEELNQLRAMGGPTGEVDHLGENYITEQERVFKQRYTNLREFQVASMIRGSYQYIQSGNELAHAFSGGSITIDYQIPAGNKSQLDYDTNGDIIGVAWDNAAAPIVRDLFAINSAFNELVGLGLTEVWVSSVVWGFIITNTEVQNLAGSVNDPVESITRNEQQQKFTARLRGAPWVTFNIFDTGLNVNGTYTKLIGDTAAAFHTPIDSSIAEYLHAPEVVMDPVTNSMKNVWGEYYYHKIQDDPVSYEFHGRFNGLPALKVPAAIMYGTVDF